MGDSAWQVVRALLRSAAKRRKWELDKARLATKVALKYQKGHHGYAVSGAFTQFRFNTSSVDSRMCVFNILERLNVRLCTNNENPYILLWGGIPNIIPYEINQLMIFLLTLIFYEIWYT